MFVFIVVFIAFVISPAVGSTIRNISSISTCRASEFTCLDGTCISDVSVCDHNWDCPDGSDEEFCYSSTQNLTEDAVTHGRFKRQSKCGLYQWQCADGTCISVDGKCDGKVDCRDKSDETFARCRNTKCQSNWFRCTYGACVDGTAPCNNIVECADRSDELHPRCRNDTRLDKEKYRCLDGNTIPAVDYCDGVSNCPDGSDETVQACAGQNCAKHLFQCAYGACVDQGAECNGRSDCADGSDESAELCNTIPPGIENRLNVLTGQCVLPPYPEHGKYVVSNAPFATPSQALAYATLNISCDKGYGMVSDDVVFCQDGIWHDLDMLKCVPFCKLDPHVSVRYYCLVFGQIEGRRPCKLWEPVGTEIKPECNSPNYFSDDNLRYMRCERDGAWNRIVKCKPECGRLTPDGEGQVIGIGGKPAMRGELPWHVAIYQKPTQDKNYYELICGGSLVSNSVVISAAHCFWDDKLKKQAASKYAVATAKLRRDWNHKDDVDAQKSELKSIELPDLYQGAMGNHGLDIAVLILETPFVYYNYVRPVCLHFGYEFNERQLEPGNLGKVAGFGYTSVNGDPSPVLKVVELPVVSSQECLRRTPTTFSENITGDKICAGYSNGTAALCKGDSGGGLSFPESALGLKRYYLRGIVSTAPKSDTKCNLFTVTTFTQIFQYEHHINKFL